MGNNTKKNILMLGVGVDQLPAIQIALELGWGVVGFDGNPKAVGAKYVNHFEVVDIRKPDLVEKKALYLNKKMGIDAVIAPATEMGISCGRIVDRLGLPGIGEKKATKLTNKIERRDFLDSIEVRQPRYNYCAEESLNELIRDWPFFPCIIKPCDQMAAVGVRYIEDKKQLRKNKDFDIVEEYLEGWEISTEVLVIGNTPICVHADRHYDKKLKWKPAVIEDGCSVPSNIDQRIKDKINNIVTKIVHELNLYNCALKLDILIKDNQVYIIECAPRMGGGKLSSKMIPMAYGIDHWKCAIMLAMGMPIDWKDLMPKRKKFVVQRYVFPNKVQNHKDRLYSVECDGDTYEEAEKKVYDEISKRSSGQQGEDPVE